MQAFGFGLTLLKFIQSYLFDRKQRVKTNSFFSDYGNVEPGVFQGLISGPLCCNILIFYLYFNDIIIDLVDYLNGTTPYVYTLENEKVI